MADAGGDPILLPRLLPLQLQWRQVPRRGVHLSIRRSHPQDDQRSATPPTFAPLPNFEIRVYLLVVVALRHLPSRFSLEMISRSTAGIDFMEFRPSEIAAAVAISELEAAADEEVAGALLSRCVHLDKVSPVPLSPLSL